MESHTRKMNAEGDPHAPTLYHAVEHDFGVPTGRGMKALKALQKGDVVLELPSENLVTPKKCREFLTDYFSRPKNVDPPTRAEVEVTTSKAKATEILKTQNSTSTSSFSKFYSTWFEHDQNGQYFFVRISPDFAAVQNACRASGIDEEFDVYRKKFLGKVVLVKEVDPSDESFSVVDTGSSAATADVKTALWFGFSGGAVEFGMDCGVVSDENENNKILDLVLQQREHIQAALQAVSDENAMVLAVLFGNKFFQKKEMKHSGGRGQAQNSTAARRPADEPPLPQLKHESLFHQLLSELPVENVNMCCEWQDAEIEFLKPCEKIYSSAKEQKAQVLQSMGKCVGVLRYLESEIDVQARHSRHKNGTSSSADGAGQEEKDEKDCAGSGLFLRNAFSFTIREFVHAWTRVASRHRAAEAFPNLVEKGVDGKTLMIVGGADMFNHSLSIEPGNSTVEHVSQYDEPNSSTSSSRIIKEHTKTSNKSVQILCQQENVPAGGEVFISYGDKPNEELLLGYGFALDQNQFDAFEIVIGLEKYDQARRRIVPGTAGLHQQRSKSITDLRLEVTGFLLQKGLERKELEMLQDEEREDDCSHGGDSTSTSATSVVFKLRKQDDRRARGLTTTTNCSFPKTLLAISRLEKMSDLVLEKIWKLNHWNNRTTSAKNTSGMILTGGPSSSSGAQKLADYLCNHGLCPVDASATPDSCSRQERIRNSRWSKITEAFGGSSAREDGIKTPVADQEENEVEQAKEDEDHQHLDLLPVDIQVLGSLRKHFLNTYGEIVEKEKTAKAAAVTWSKTSTDENFNTNLTDNPKFQMAKIIIDSQKQILRESIKFLDQQLVEDCLPTAVRAVRNMIGGNNQPRCDSTTSPTSSTFFAKKEQERQQACFDLVLQKDLENEERIQGDTVALFQFFHSEIMKPISKGTPTELPVVAGLTTLCPITSFWAEICLLCFSPMGNSINQKNGAFALSRAAFSTALSGNDRVISDNDKITTPSEQTRDDSEIDDTAAGTCATDTSKKNNLVAYHDLYLQKLSYWGKYLFSQFLSNNFRPLKQQEMNVMVQESLDLRKQHAWSVVTERIAEKFFEIHQQSKQIFPMVEVGAGHGLWAKVLNDEELRQKWEKRNQCAGLLNKLWSEGRRQSKSPALNLLVEAYDLGRWEDKYCLATAVASCEEAGGGGGGGGSAAAAADACTAADEKRTGDNLDATSASQRSQVLGESERTEIFRGGPEVLKIDNEEDAATRLQSKNTLFLSWPDYEGKGTFGYEAVKNWTETCCRFQGTEHVEGSRDKFSSARTTGTGITTAGATKSSKFLILVGDFFYNQAFSKECRAYVDTHYTELRHLSESLTELLPRWPLARDEIRVYQLNGS
ncbi:unnamed protein product [Amoebophrya sp. A120]|nr:unnamed protein product [Amoebophrya sp. A120]|eukprot:GSA120T00016520001.1